MLRFTKRVDYGLMAMQYVALNQGIGQGMGAVGVRRIADELSIPAELLAKILQRLARRGLIVSQSGPKGGYALARHPGDIAVGEVVRALEGPVSIVGCFAEDSDCPQTARCNLRRPARKLQAAITQLLDATSLAELIGEEVDQLSIEQAPEGRRGGSVWH